MSTSAVGNLSNSYLQQVLVSALRSAGITANSSQSDSAQLSPLAQLAGTLQQLQESDPAKYKQTLASAGTSVSNS